MLTNLISRSEAARLACELRQRGMKLVFTNGCFDLLHQGHVFYLEEARHLGDCLFVGLNSDRSVRSIKGPTRPVNDQISRAAVLGSIRSVDYVVIFDEDDPRELIKAITPDVLVKGSDWKEEDILGGDYVKQNGGTVKTIPVVQGVSTTAIIEEMANVRVRDYHSAERHI